MEKHFGTGPISKLTDFYHKLNVQLWMDGLSAEEVYRNENRIHDPTQQLRGRPEEVFIWYLDSVTVRYKASIPGDNAAVDLFGDEDRIRDVEAKMREGKAKLEARLKREIDIASRF